MNLVFILFVAACCVTTAIGIFAFWCGYALGYQRCAVDAETLICKGRETARG